MALHEGRREGARSVGENPKDCGMRRARSRCPRDHVLRRETNVATFRTRDSQLDRILQFDVSTGVANVRCAEEGRARIWRRDFVRGFRRKETRPVIDGKRASRIKRWASRERDCVHESVRTMIDKDLRGVAEWSRCAFEKEDAGRGVHLKTVHAKRVFTQRRAHMREMKIECSRSIIRQFI